MDKSTVGSKQHIIDTLYSLLDQESIQNITVESICETGKIKSDIFNVYYSDLNDVFDDCQRQIYQDISAALDQTNSDLGTLIEAFNGHMYSNFENFKRLYNCQKHYLLIEALEQKLFGSLERALLVNQTSANDQLVLQYLSSGLIHSYIYWIDHPDSFSYQEMKIINQEIVQANLAILK